MRRCHSLDTIAETSRRKIKMKDYTFKGLKEFVKNQYEAIYMEDKSDPPGKE